MNNNLNYKRNILYFLKTGISRGVFGTGSKVIFFLMHILPIMLMYAGLSLRNGLIFCGVLILCTHWGRGATISYVGTQTSTAANGYAAANWSNAGVLKDFDVSGEKYGTSGYYQIRPMPWDPGAAELGEAAGSGNLLGTDASSSTTFSSAPSFLSSITGGVGTFVNYGGYGIFRGPDGSSLYRQGGLSVSVSNGAFDTPSGNNNGYFGVAFEFTVSSPTAFRIGITVDANGGGAYAPDYVGIYSVSTGTVFSGLLDRNAEPDMAIFEINAMEGETFAAAVWQRSGTQSVAPVSLVTFDEILSDITPPVIEAYSVTGDYLVITAIVRTDNPKLTVVGESVTNLDNYASGTSVVEVQGADAADQGGVPEGCMRRTFSVAIEGSVTKKFLRLKASLAQ